MEMVFISIHLVMDIFIYLNICQELTESSHYSGHWVVDKRKAFVFTVILYGFSPPEYDLCVKYMLDHDMTDKGAGHVTWGLCTG